MWTSVWFHFSGSTGVQSLELYLPTSFQGVSHRLRIHGDSHLVLLYRNSHWNHLCRNSILMVFSPEMQVLMTGWTCTNSSEMEHSLKLFSWEQFSSCSPS